MLLKRSYTFFFIIYFTFASDEQLHLYVEEVRDLSELPLDKLIRIKTNLASDDVMDGADFDEEIEERTAVAFPMAMPLRKFSEGPIVSRGDHGSSGGKDTKISKIFQLAITTLAFLAFGGYLLALVCSAIRRNANNPATTPGNVIVFSNLETFNKFKRPKRRALIMDPMENEFNTDRLYRGMIMLSEGYASYTTK